RRHEVDVRRTLPHEVEHDVGKLALGERPALPLNVPACGLAELAAQIAVGEEDRARAAPRADGPLLAEVQIRRRDERLRPGAARPQLPRPVDAAVPAAQPA